jgi:diguanylate cyclase (GGDEF)-like protein
VTLALLDIDYFKIYNDLYGHVAGDECLRAVALQLSTRARSENAFIARYGGEEFALIIESLEPVDAVAAVGRVFTVFEEKPILHDGSTLGRVSISAGVASADPGSGRSIADLVRDADRSLYRAKGLGRNRICAGAYASTGQAAARHARTVTGPPPFEDATVGREAEVTRLLAALRQERMITLVGPAGIGKSRLARTAAGAAQQFHSDGIAYVDLALLGPEADPVGALGAALDVALESGDLREGLIGAMHERETLVVFDNVNEGAAKSIGELASSLLEDAPSLSILATSRSALGCLDERVIVVPPLSEEAAVELLRVRSGGTDLPALRRIAHYLNGVPASIEAVARYVAQHGSGDFAHYAEVSDGFTRDPAYQPNGSARTSLLAI